MNGRLPVPELVSAAKPTRETAVQVVPQLA
jgi:hypothetical protein